MAKHHHSEKVRVTIECTTEERSYIKMLAAHKHMTISEYFLAFAKQEIACNEKIPNKATLAAHQEALGGAGTSYGSMDDFWKDMEIDRRAES